jgi:uncharacterized protein (TIGR02246 family)
MPTPRVPQLLPPLESPDDVEAQFYDALRDADIGRLMALWSDDDDIVCVHPGGQRLIGAASIRASFEAIFERGGIPVQHDRVRRARSGDAALHSVVETVTVSEGDGGREGHVLALNVYFKTALGWRLVAHHASPGATQEPSDGADARTTLH